MFIPDHFSVQELVCQHTYAVWGERSIQFMDDRLLINLNWIRKTLGKPITINNYSYPHKGKTFRERGLRCNLCSLVKEKTDDGELYLTAHIMGKALDFDVRGMNAWEVRSWLSRNQFKLPHPIRLELNRNWVHMDVRWFEGSKNVYMFNP